MTAEMLMGPNSARILEELLKQYDYMKQKASKKDIAFRVEVAGDNIV